MQGRDAGRALERARLSKWEREQCRAINKLKANATCDSVCHFSADAVRRAAVAVVVAAALNILHMQMQTHTYMHTLTSTGTLHTHTSTQTYVIGFGMHLHDDDDDDSVANSNLFEVILRQSAREREKKRRRKAAAKDGSMLHAISRNGKGNSNNKSIREPPPT